MCGRYSFTVPPEAMRWLFALTGPLPNFEARYNIAPTQDAPVIRLNAASGERKAAMFRWGLVPSWSKGPDSRHLMINARAETVAEKPAFRAALRHRRCLVPADGFYEWRKEGARKQPYRICQHDGEPFALAGLWERWEGAGEAIHSFAIVVTEANDLVRPIHDRMPVILDPLDYGAWLGAGAADEATRLLKPFGEGELTAYPVSLHVNSPKNDDRGCIDPVDSEAGNA